MQEHAQTAMGHLKEADARMDPNRQPDTKDAPESQQPNVMNDPVPHVGQPLDGRHYLDVLEEQAHADQKPQPDGENPRHPDIDKSP